MNLVTVKASPDGSLFVKHCAWCNTPGEIVSRFPCLKGIPFTSGICEGHRLAELTQCGLWVKRETEKAKTPAGNSQNANGGSNA